MIVHVACCCKHIRMSRHRYWPSLDIADTLAKGIKMAGSACACAGFTIFFNAFFMQSGASIRGSVR
ncbi:hypothetical protein [Sphingomonas quercus]|uniref:Uncharacterized protein n=1 Tax=Sphingomonas quercus TaxID=2842451 RepID=A0ABS6BH38_9SPHN|nr:hypothetical protein [Sphingomonas quercus]MBU3077494.1 hypothetical protein [Sphingomonas quercus]